MLEGGEKNIAKQGTIAIGLYLRVGQGAHNICCGYDHLVEIEKTEAQRDCPRSHSTNWQTQYLNPSLA